MFYILVLYFGTYTYIMVPMLRFTNTNATANKGANTMQYRNSTPVSMVFFIVYLVAILVVAVLMF